MSIGVGATQIIASSSLTGTATTTAVTTSATGSTFYVSVLRGDINVATTTVTDSKGNTYVQIGSDVTNTNNRTASRFYAKNGNGGSGHTITATSGTSTSSALTVFLVEITGANLTAPLDQSNTNDSNFSAMPFTSNNITITPPSTGELLISTFNTTTFATALTFTETQGFTIQQQNVNGEINAPSGAIGTLIKTSAGTYNASWNDGSGGDASLIAVIDSFLGTSSAANTASIAWVS
jgi:hypothetical protein